MSTTTTPPKPKPSAPAAPVTTAPASAPPTPSLSHPDAKPLTHPVPIGTPLPTPPGKSDNENASDVERVHEHCKVLLEGYGIPRTGNLWEDFQAVIRAIR